MHRAKVRLAPFIFLGLNGAHDKGNGAYDKNAVYRRLRQKLTSRSIKLHILAETGSGS